MRWQSFWIALPLLMIGGCASSPEAQVSVPPGTPSCITVEARFVEVSEADLDELGFEWLLTDDWELNGKASGSQTETQRGVHASARQRR
jgi:hypothetical protein